MAATELLDEKGFIFIDDNSRPFWVAMRGDRPWLMRWHVDKRWVTVRELNQTDVWIFGAKAIPEHEAKLYHDLHNR